MIETIHIQEKRYNLPYINTWKKGGQMSAKEERIEQIKLLKKENPPKYVLDFFEKNDFNRSYTEPFEVTINRALKQANVLPDELIDIKFTVTSAGTSEDYFIEREALVIYKC